MDIDRNEDLQVKNSLSRSDACVSQLFESKSSKLREFLTTHNAPEKIEYGQFPYIGGQKFLLISISTYLKGDACDHNE